MTTEGRLKPDGSHEALQLGDLIKALQEVEAQIGPNVSVATVDGVGDSREMWGASAEFGTCSIWLTAEPGY